MSKNKVVIVLGCPRSGTSIVAGMLHILGANMGEDLRQKDRFNKKGYFEDWELMRLNGKLTELENIKGWDFRPYVGHEDNSLVLEEIKEAIEKRNKKYNVWGMKIGNNKTLEYWINILSRTSYDLKFIFTHRAPSTLAPSIMKRKGFKKITALRYIYQSHLYNKANEDLIKDWGFDMMTTVFKLTKNYPTKYAKQICQFIGLEWSPEKKAKIKDFIY